MLRFQSMPRRDNLIGEGRLVRLADSNLQWGSVMGSMIAQALCRRGDRRNRHVMSGTETEILNWQRKKY